MTVSQNLSKDFYDIGAKLYLDEIGASATLSRALLDGDQALFVKKRAILDPASTGQGPI